jgi:hypothetical protein
MKSKHLEIENLCHSVFRSVCSLTEGSIVNKELAFADKDNYLQQYNNWIKKMDAPRPFVAKAWFLFFVFASLILKEMIRDEPNFVRPIMLIIVLAPLLKLYQLTFGSMPFESIGINLFLNEADRKLCESEAKFNMTYLQAQRMSPLSFFNSNPLTRTFQLGEFDCFEHEAILRCLFGLKNNSFDCVSISALVVLTLIEQKLPASILRVRSGNASIAGHHYVLVNLAKDCKLYAIQTWNDDAILIDPWYGVCVSAKEIKADNNFFKKYPLLTPYDKNISKPIEGDKPTPSYQFAVSIFKQLRDQFVPTENHLPSHLDILYPRLPTAIKLGI